MGQNSLENQEEILDSIINDFRKVQGVLSDVDKNFASVVDSLSEDDTNYINYIKTLNSRKGITHKKLDNFSSNIDGYILILTKIKEEFIDTRNKAKDIEHKHGGE